MEVVLILPKDLAEFAFQTKQDVNLSVFDLIKEKMSKIHEKKDIYDANLNVNLTVKNVIKIKPEMSI